MNFHVLFVRWIHFFNNIYIIWTGEKFVYEKNY